MAAIESVTGRATGDGDRVIDTGVGPRLVLALSPPFSLSNYRLPLRLCIAQNSPVYGQS